MHKDIHEIVFTKSGRRCQIRYREVGDTGVKALLACEGVVIAESPAVPRDMPENALATLLAMVERGDVA